VSLGLEPVEQELNGFVMGTIVPSGPTGATAVPGVWVAGNVTDMKAQVIVSAAAGLNVAAAINMDLIDEDTRDAVIAHRAFSDDLEREVSELVLGNRRHGL
jgi:thioredoxin reductase (NADPH)